MRRRANHVSVCVLSMLERMGGGGGGGGGAWVRGCVCGEIEGDKEREKYCCSQ